MSDGRRGMVPQDLTRIAFVTDAQISPDGRRIAFVRSFGRNREICVMRADGSAQRRLTHNPGADESPDWQPLR